MKWVIDGGRTVHKTVGMATLGTMLTFTTYGTWLRGDARGWVDDGIVMPPDPPLEACDRERMKYEAFRFDAERLLAVGDAIGVSLRERQSQTILALTVQTWHVHIVIGTTSFGIDQVVKCAKDAGRYHLRLGRPLWSDGYDKRFCFDGRALAARVDYVERHNERLGWPRRPWSWLTPFDQYLRECGFI
jgi:hypothetical protein